ncbi:MAG: hypothetical protein VCA74_01645 [Deltaproteobacteria bacterium]
MQHFLIFTHVSAVGVYLGATVLLTALTFTMDRSPVDAVRRRQRFAMVFAAYNPLAIAVLGIMVMTGAMALTQYKQDLGPQYFAVLGAVLAPKLGLAFIVVMLGTYICFGLGHRLVRADQGALPTTDAELDRMLKRLRGSLVVTLAITFYTLWFALSA